MVKPTAVTLFNTLFSFTTIFAITWGFLFEWPDYVHVNYGFPIVWGTHVLNTIAGPVDVWRVDVSTLFLDLLFWLGAMVIGGALMPLLKRDLRLHWQRRP